jgi:hypothetical protein
MAYEFDEAMIPKMKLAFCVFNAVCMFLIMIALFVIAGKSGFMNMPDYGIGQRSDIVYSHSPVMDERSLNQKVDQWTAQTKSQLTGSRDIPAFFEGHEYEAARKSENNGIKADREGFQGGISQDDLESILKRG